MRSRVLLMALFFGVVVIYAGSNGYFYVVRNMSAGFLGWSAGNSGTITTNRISNNSQLELHDGDQIIALDGQPFRSLRDYLVTFDQRPPQTTYNIVVQRNAEIKQFTLLTTIAPRRVFWLNFLIWLVVPLAFLGTGAIVFWLRPFDKRALMLGLLFGMFATGPPSPGLVFSHLPAPFRGTLVVAYVASWAFPVVLFHFFLVFPAPATLLKRAPRLETFLYLPWLSGILPLAVLQGYFWLTSPARFFDTAQDFRGMTRVALALTVGYILAGLTSLVMNYIYANQVLRHEMHVVLAGSIVGFLPFGLLVATLSSFGKPAINESLSGLMIAAFLLLLVVPVSFAYAIVRHRVIPVSLIIRQGVQYVLAKNALRVLLAVPIIGLVIDLFTNLNRTLSEILFRRSLYFYLLFGSAAGLSLALRKRLTVWVDRKFFREVYDQERILRQLIEEVKQLTSMRELSRLVSRRVEVALHPEQLYLFYREGRRRDFSLGYSSSSASLEQRIPEGFRLLDTVEGTSRAQDFPLARAPRLPQLEEDWLTQLGVSLIVPMNGTDGQLIGLFLLGQKKSQSHYTNNDRALLEALANQIALVYENLRLRERVNYASRVNREVLGRLVERDVNLLKECSQCGTCFDSDASVCVYDQTELSLSLPVERTIDQRYRLERLIGKGGMSAVYEAQDLRLGRSVAVKVLRGSRFGDDQALRRFEREAQTSARLHHPNIIGVHDYGILNTEGAYLVMELARGETLGSILKRSGHLQPQTAALWLGQLLEGVRVAHQAGIIHRDLKPDNILITHDDGGRALVKILDFGLAKFTQPDISSARSVTTPGTVIGTFGYMSPEQLTGAHMDERSDIFSLGVLVVEVLTGRRPFEGNTYHELLTNLLQGSFHLASDSKETQTLNGVIQRCLAKKREDRFASVEDLQQELIPAMFACSRLEAYPTDTSETDTLIFEDNDPH